MVGVLAQAQEVSFPTSAFVPLAMGFFGLGTGYLIYGPQELFKLPGRDRAVDLITGIWGVWMPGFLQFVTGVILFVGLAWLHTFRAPPLYMAALAFTAYGVHWWALGMGRALGGDPRPNAFMAIAFTSLSALGVVVFFLGAVAFGQPAACRSPIRTAIRSPRPAPRTRRPAAGSLARQPPARSGRVERSGRRHARR
jgi:hypothetical protein